MDSVETIQNAAMERSGGCTVASPGVFVHAVSAGKAIKASLGYFMLPLLTIMVAASFQGNTGLGATHCSSAGSVRYWYRCCRMGVCPDFLVVSSSFALYGAMRKKIEADTMQGLY